MKKCTWCGSEKDVFLSEDPFVAEVYPEREDADKQEYICRKCYRERQEEI